MLNGVTSQVKLSNNFWKTRSKKGRSSLPVSLRSILKTLKVALENEHKVNRKSSKLPRDLPSVHRRVDVAKIPLICWNLPIRFHVPLSCENVELFLCKGRVDHCKRDAMKRRVPRGEERVLPPERVYHN
jgi:hypothetical protein